MPLAAWRPGGLAAWRPGGLAAWRPGGLVAWRAGGLAGWWLGGLGAWWAGGVAGWCPAWCCRVAAAWWPRQPGLRLASACGRCEREVVMWPRLRAGVWTHRRSALVRGLSGVVCPV